MDIWERTQIRETVAWQTRVSRALWPYATVTGPRALWRVPCLVPHLPSHSFAVPRARESSAPSRLAACISGAWMRRYLGDPHLMKWVSGIHASLHNPGQ
ncbi:hypothetical protein AAFF_G00407670 [Aldrovandia affinis]|uniref:Uncharacterized protein n=1 Tax=Aldrovandia affinis TaxID=143900 RepID=A0AAD7SBP5_9TELE|nr:hypothetical protein AAFF_G00407670 [Aldrovandia affinis]